MAVIEALPCARKPLIDAGGRALSSDWILQRAAFLAGISLGYFCSDSYDLLLPVVQATIPHRLRLACPLC